MCFEAGRDRVLASRRPLGSPSLGAPGRVPDERLATQLSLLAIGLASEAALHGWRPSRPRPATLGNHRSTSMDSDYATLSRLTTFLRTQAGVS